MKAIMISASPHNKKSNTFILAQEAAKGLRDEGLDCEIIHLSEHRVGFCRHCEECHRKILHCSIKDAVPLILNKMLEKDAIILASPNYINQVTAQMKAFFDRSAHFIHCKRLLGKYIAGVVTSGSGQDKEVLDYISYYAHVCGAQYSGGISSAAHTVKEKLESAYQLGRKIALDVKEHKMYAEQMHIIEQGKEHFKKIIIMRKDDWKEEYKYWQDKGWL